MRKPAKKRSGGQPEGKTIRFSDGDLLPYWMGERNSFVYFSPEKLDIKAGDLVTLSAELGPDEISEFPAQITNITSIDLSKTFQLSAAEIADFPATDMLKLYKALAQDGQRSDGGHCLLARFKKPRESSAIARLGRLLCEKIAENSEGHIDLDDMAFTYQLLRDQKTGKLSREFEIAFLTPVDEEYIEDFVDWIEDFTDIEVWHDPGEGFWNEFGDKEEPDYELRYDPDSDYGDADDDDIAPVTMVTISSDPRKLLRKIEKAGGSGPAP